jgi:hypothetical protein
MPASRGKGAKGWRRRHEQVLLVIAAVVPLLQVRQGTNRLRFGSSTSVGGHRKRAGEHPVSCAKAEAATAAAEKNGEGMGVMAAMRSSLNLVVSDIGSAVSLPSHARLFRYSETFFFTNGREGWPQRCSPAPLIVRDDGKAAKGFDTALTTTRRRHAERADCLRP